MSVAALKKAKVERPTETKHDRFLRLGKQRMDKTLRRIHQLGNLGDGNYEYTEQEKAAVITALFDAVHEVKRRFEKREKATTGFTFPN